MSGRTLVRRLTAKDFEWEYFRAGGNGGQKQNKTSSAARCRHRESGAVTESREHREQRMNRRACLAKMRDHPKFKAWARMEVARSLGQPSPEEVVEEMMAREQDFVTEVKDDRGRWVEATSERG